MANLGSKPSLLATRSAKPGSRSLDRNAFAAPERVQAGRAGCVRLVGVDAFPSLLVVDWDRFPWEVVKVEAGGIEPPSEGVPRKATTCVAYVLMSGLRLPQA